MEQDLLALGRSVAYPPTPDLTAGFWSRLEAQRRTPASRALSYAGLATATIVVVLALVIATIGPARDAAADLFDRINIFEETGSVKGIPAKIEGRTVTLEQAETALGRRIILPTEPAGISMEAVWLQEFGSRKAAVVWYHMEDGRKFAYIATNARIGKGLVADTDATATPIEGLGEEAYWLTGPRVFVFYDPDGRPIPESQRLVHFDTLMWSQGGYVYRIEGEEIKQDEQLQLARSILAQTP